MESNRCSIYQMSLSILLLLCLLASRATSESQLIASMKSNPNISVFNELFKNEIEQYTGNAHLTVFAPSDAVMRDVVLTDYDKNKVLQNHLFQSLTAGHVPVIGTTDNWSQYTRLKTRSTEFLTPRSLDQINFLLLRQTGADFFVNAALVTQPNMINGTQVYHVIDKVLLGPDQTNFLMFMNTPFVTTKKITKSVQLWKWLVTTAQKGSQNVLSKFQSFMLPFSSILTGTVLMPTDDAWTAAMSDSEFKALMYINSTGQTNSPIESIMGRFYIPNEMHFWRNNQIDLWAGFSPNSAQNTDGLVKGAIATDGQVSYDGYTARIVEPNILIKYCVVHLIDNVMYKLQSTSSILAKSNPVFLNALNKFPNISQYLNGSYSILAPDDATMAKNINSSQLYEMLLNSFVRGPNALTPNGKPASTVGNTVIRLRTDQSANSYIDSLYDASENTWIRSARVGQLNQQAGSSSVSTLNGSISKEPMSCQDMLVMLNSSMYYSLLVQHEILLHLGSPYTLLVPSDAVLIAHLAASSIGANADVVKNVLRRMIVANRLVLEKKNKVQFRAATMNNAITQETIAMSIVATNCTITDGRVERTFNFSAGGFYCFSNEVTDASRFNLIYPVPFVLDAPGRAGHRVGGTANFITALSLAALAALLARCQFRD